MNDRRCHFSRVSLALLAVGLSLLSLGERRAAAANCPPAPQTSEKQLLPPVTIGLDQSSGYSYGAVAPLPTKSMTDSTLLPGTGLCAAFKATSTPYMWFDVRDGGYPSTARVWTVKANDFMDNAMIGRRIDETMDAPFPFDLTNDIDTPTLSSGGDFAQVASNCPPRQMKMSPMPPMPINGCDFPGSKNENVRDGFGSRYRGFFNVKPEWAGVPMHFGYFANAAVAVFVWAKAKPPAPSDTPLKEYLLVSHPWTGNPAARVTQTITFPEGGLYPIEILHAHLDSSAVLEFAIFFDSGSGCPPWEDIDQGVSNMQAQLNRDGFLQIYTTPDNFFQTVSGAPPYAQSTMCQQCPRRLASSVPPSGSMICDPGYYCNEAAVCAPCIGNQFCGKSCMPCNAPKKYCIPKPQDPTDAYCVECRTDADCMPGLTCDRVNHVCTTLNDCCPGLHLVAPDPSRPSIKVCSPCATDADCNGKKCDLANLRCVDEIPACNSDTQCGKNCLDCSKVKDDKTQEVGKRPHCLNGQVCVQCKNDFDCATGSYCQSGDCVPCMADRHCGPTCQNCGRTLVPGSDGMAASTATPFCYHGDNIVANAICVRCTQDSQCGEGGQCDPKTHDCVNKSTVSCKPGELAVGDRCVTCYSSSQCQCGTCDLEKGTCNDICNDNADCLGNQCCALGPDGIRKCQPGRCSGVAGGALCGCSLGGGALAVAEVDNNTLDPNGGPAVMGMARSRGAMLAMLSMLLCALALRRRFNSPFSVTRTRSGWRAGGAP